MKRKIKTTRNNIFFAGFFLDLFWLLIFNKNMRSLQRQKKEKLNRGIRCPTFFNLTDRTTTLKAESLSHGIRDNEEAKMMTQRQRQRFPVVLYPSFIPVFWVDFTNILCTDPISAKKDWRLDCIFCTFGICSR